MHGLAGHQRVERGAQAKDVGSCIDPIALTASLLGGHERRGAERSSCGGSFARLDRFAKNACRAELRDAQVSLFAHDEAVWPHVAMDDLLVVSRLEGFAQGDSVLDHVLGRKRSTTFHAELFESVAVDELERDHHRALLGDPVAKDTDHARVLDAIGDVSFAFEAGHEGGVVGFVGVEYL
jgi:hypothetical protein